MNKSPRQIIFAVIAILVLNATFVFSQETKSNLTTQVKNERWFIAQVISSEPFVLEYLDSWNSQKQKTSSSYSKHIFSVGEVNDIEPEIKKKFKRGDILIGELCIPEFDGDCGKIKTEENSEHILDSQSGIVLRLDSKIINLRKVGKSEKKKYKGRGFLFRYSPEDRKIRNLSVFRDGTVVIIDYFGGLLSRRLSKKQTSSLVKDYLRKRIHQLPYNEKLHIQMPGLISSVSNYQKIEFENAPNELKKFTTRLDNLIESIFKSAEYKINYRWKHHIKVWEFGDILPLDKLVTDKKTYFETNQKQIAKNVRLKTVLENAHNEYREKELSLFLYNGIIYEISFLPCKSELAFSIDCFQVWEVRDVKENYDSTRTSKVFWNWSEKVLFDLKDIPKAGLDISKSEFTKHKDYYSTFQYASSRIYKEGEYIYSGIYINYR